MENAWLKEKVKEELEIEYKQKLDEVVALYEKKIDQCHEKCYQMLLTERAKNDQLEVKLYEEYEKKLVEFKQFLKDEHESKIADHKKEQDCPRSNLEK